MKLFARYILALYLKVAVGVFAIALVMFFVLEFFQRIGSLLEHRAPLGAATVYFALKLPTLLNEVYPAAALLSVMISVGILAKNREILAMTAAGISARQIGTPILLASALLSLAMFCWNDFVVPPTAARSRHIRDNVIRGQDAVGILGQGSIWLQDGSTFVTAGFYNPEKLEIYDVSLYETDENFRVLRIVEIPEARWSEPGGWFAVPGTVKSVEGENASVTLRPAGPLSIGIAPRAFDKRRRKNKEMTYPELSRLLDEMQRRGAATTSLAVDLALKLAWPCSGFVTAAIGLPLALRRGKHHGPLYNAGLALMIAFAYWITFAVSIAAGRTGAIPPTLAAWAPNVLFLIAGFGMQQEAGRGR